MFELCIANMYLYLKETTLIFFKVAKLMEILSAMTICFMCSQIFLQGSFEVTKIALVCFESVMNSFDMTRQAWLVIRLMITKMTGDFHAFVFGFNVDFQICCCSCPVLTIWTRISDAKVSPVFVQFKMTFSWIFFVTHVTFPFLCHFWTVHIFIVLYQIVSFPWA